MISVKAIRKKSPLRFSTQIQCVSKTVIFLDWVNLGSPWWSHSLAGLDPVDLIGWMEWI